MKKGNLIGKIFRITLVVIILVVMLGGLANTTYAQSEKTVINVIDGSPWFTKGSYSGHPECWWLHNYNGHYYYTTYVGGWSWLGGSPTQADAWARFTPYLSQSGEYDVYTYFFACPDTSTQVPFWVYHSGGVTKVTVNQYSSYNTWKSKYLGRWSFSAGSYSGVLVTDNTGETYDAVTGLSVGTVQFVKVNQEPTCSVSASPNSGQAPLTVTFYMSASDPDGSISAWVLDVDGDGNNDYSGTGSPPATQTHTYTSPSPASGYSVVLMVSDNDGATAFDTETVVVGENSPPTCSLSASPNSGQAPLTVTFYMSASDPDGWIESWVLDVNFDGVVEYSGGGYPPSTLTHTYQNAGTYTALLMVSDNDDVTDPDFTTVIVNQPDQGPTADFSADVTSCCEPLTVQFADQSTTGSNPIVSWYWQFGDGDTSTAQNPSNSYDAGTYTVSLTVTDSHGYSDTETKENYIMVYARPTATASSNSPVSQGATIQLYGGPNGMDSYSWTGSGGWTSSLQNPNRPNATMAMGGTYTLTVTNSNGCTDSDTTSVTVNEGDAIPPTMSSVSPQNGDTDVAIDIVVTATFSEAMDSSTIDANSFTLAGSAVLGTVTYNPATYTATFTPDADLEYDHTYTASLSTAITDVAGNPLAEPYTWSFSTLTITQYKTEASITPGTPTYQLAHTGTRLKYFTTVSNQGSDTDTIEVEAQGDPNLDWLIMLVPGWDNEYPSTPVDNNKFQVVLPPGESADYYVYVDIGTGGNSIDISATSIGDPDQSMNCTVKAWSLPPGSGLFAAKLLFENPNEEGDTLIFDVPSNTMLSENYISLGPSEQEWVRVMYDPKSADEAYNTWINVYSMHSGNEITIPIEFGPYYDVAATEFDMAQDSYNFQNLLGVFCYGMSETSILYYQGELSLPASKPNTYSLTEAEAWGNIVWHHRLFERNFLAGIKLRLLNVDLAEEYNKLKTSIQNGKPMILAVEGHAVVAYRIFETGSKSYIYIYDSERPYNPPGDDEWSDNFFLAFPYATYDLISHEFDYSNSYNEFLALEAETFPMEDLPIVMIVACPVDVTVTDQSGRIIDNLDTNEIPDAWFAAFGEEKYFFLPKDLAYSVHIDAFEEGEFDLAVVSPMAKNEALITHSPHISVNVTTLADFEIEPHAQSYVMEIDYDGDGIIEELRVPNVYEILEPKSQVTGCFIATAAYGTLMADEVQTLRDFRDEYLLSNPLGQALVDLYYQVSPPIAEFITDHPSLKPIVRAGLVPAVAMSTIVVTTAPAEKIAILGLLVFVSVAVAIWAMRRRGRWTEHT